MLSSRRDPMKVFISLPFLCNPLSLLLLVSSSVICLSARLGGDTLGFYQVNQVGYSLHPHYSSFDQYYSQSQLTTHLKGYKISHNHLDSALSLSLSHINLQHGYRKRKSELPGCSGSWPTLSETCTSGEANWNHTQLCDSVDDKGKQ